MRSDPHEAMRRLSEFAKDDREEQFFGILNCRLRDAELPVAETTTEVRETPLIYIVGAPRSGTTVLSQLASRYLPVGYVNNLIARFWLRPSVGVRLSRVLLGEAGRKNIDLGSVHGVTSGVAGPHEFGYFWRYWLRLDLSPTHHLLESALAQVDADGLRRVLEQEIIGTFEAPVVFKNVICGFQAAFLSRLHAKSLFVHITRDLHATAASILATRKQRYGSYAAWWSVKPSTYPFGDVTGGPAAEVVRQVVDCRREIEDELERPGVQGITVRYEDLCAAPADVLRRICHALRTFGRSIDVCEDEIPVLPTGGLSPLPERINHELIGVIERSARLQ